MTMRADRISLSSKSVCSCSGGISFTRADQTEKGSGGNLRTAADYARAMSGLSMYPEVGELRPILGIASAGQSSVDITCFHLHSVVWSNTPAGLTAQSPLRAVDQALCMLSLVDQTLTSAVCMASPALGCVCKACHHSSAGAPLSRQPQGVRCRLHCGALAAL